MKLNETIKKNKQAQEFIKELHDTEKQLNIQRAKLQEVEQNLKNDKAVYDDYKQQLNQAVNSDTTELKNLNRLIQDVEKDLQVTARMRHQIENTVQTLRENIRKIKENLFKLLSFIVKKERRILEYGKGADSLNPFLNLNEQFVESVDKLFIELGLQRLDFRKTRLSIIGNYRFIEHLSSIGNPVILPYSINNAQSHKEFYDKKLKRLKRIIRNFGKPRTLKLPEESKEQKDTGLMNKITNSVKTLGKVAMKVNGEEMDKIFIK